jgi:hypothetical protein
MFRNRPVALLVLLALLPLAVSCSVWRAVRPQADPPPAGITPTRIDYVDADAFDVLLENALVNQDPAIVIQTTHTKPDWGDRLNAWIAAWNLGGRAATGEKFRMQAAFVPKIVVDGDSIREFRLLVEGLMGRLDERAQQGLAWLSEERLRSRRVKLLKPYNLRFHMDEDGFIQLILFNGRYADAYPEFVRRLAAPDAGEGWERKYVCSQCNSQRSEPKRTGPAMRLTSGGEAPP